MFGVRRRGEVHVPESVVGEPDLPQPIGLRAWPQTDGLSGEGLADVPGLIGEGQEAAGPDVPQG